jgi:hypothetical protein
MNSLTEMVQREIERDDVRREALGDTPAPRVLTIGTRVALTDGSHEGWTGKVTFLVVAADDTVHAEVMFPDGSVVNAPRKWLTIV